MILFKNAKIVTPNELLEDHYLIVEDGKFVGITDTACEADSYVDCHGGYILPGIIDIHSDMIENVIQPRSTSTMEFDIGLIEAGKILVGCGITTMYHSVSMYRMGNWDTKEIRTAPLVKKLAKKIKELQSKPHLINHRYHLRYEIDNIECYDEVVSLIEGDSVNLLSLMDHTPGQGQYRNLSIYRKHLPGEGKNLTDEEFEENIQKEIHKEKVSSEKLQKLVILAHEKGICVASHDDDTAEKIEANLELGIQVSEFPINLETAKAAHEKGIMTLFGAPNVLMGRSHSGNVSAIDAIKDKCADILCSDYYPQALIQSVLKLYKQNILSLNEACNMVSLNPAKAMGIEHMTGSIEVGKQADFIVVKDDKIMQTWVSGNQVYEVKYFI